MAYLKIDESLVKRLRKELKALNFYHIDPNNDEQADALTALEGHLANMFQHVKEFRDATNEE